MKICKKCKAVNSSKANYCKFCNSNIKNAHKVSLIKSFKNLIKPKEKDETNQIEQKDEAANEEASPKNSSFIKKVLSLKKFTFKNKKCLVQETSNQPTKNGFETEIKDKLSKFENSLTTPTKASFVNLASNSSLTKIQNENLIQNEDDLSQVDFNQKVKNKDLIKNPDTTQNTNFIDAKDDKKLLEDITIKKPKMKKPKKEKPVKIQKASEVNLESEERKPNIFVKFINLILFLVLSTFLIALILFLLSEFDSNLHLNFL